MKNKLFLCIHGHFYQPPRENPRTGEIEKQISAGPFHDWNERIYQECYKPNTEAIIIDSKGDVLERVNNFEYLNFNFGPTLIQWLKNKHPEKYQRIINADKKSVSIHNGHGNAIAQVYNHIIMPLANKRDKLTQIRWGVYDFEFHFGRKPEGMWLAETACNYDTLEALINEGIKFIILDPSQALSVRNFKSELWEDVSTGNIDTKIPYRAFSKINREKHIDIFFYDGPLSKNIAFDDVIYSSERLMDRINMLKINNYEKPQLISMAVDGETFGHHKKFTDRTIAYLLSKLAVDNDFKVVNYSEYLSMFPPEYEIKIKPGIDNEGTSWSCIHGVGRWRENCGCHTGGENNWNQEWRKPLRNALNILRDKLEIIFELEGRKYFKDVWNARDEYISLILDSSEQNKINFLNSNSIKLLNQIETDEAFNLLKMQMYSMLMFTSCGWFFSDISGIETQQILSYAKMAIELANGLSGIEIEEEFIDELSKAKSNKPEFINGAYIYKQIL